MESLRLVHSEFPIHHTAMSTLTALPQLYSFGHPLDMDDDKVGLLRDSSDAANDIDDFGRITGTASDNGKSLAFKATPYLTSSP